MTKMSFNTTSEFIMILSLFWKDYCCSNQDAYVVGNNTVFNAQKVGQVVDIFAVYEQTMASQNSSCKHSTGMSVKLFAIAT